MGAEARDDIGLFYSSQHGGALLLYVLIKSTL
jgi:hypothetical protein